MFDEVIFEKTSPWGNITAYVEDDGEAVYFYLYGPEEIIPMGETPDDWFPVRGCWVCNRVPVSEPGGVTAALVDIAAGRAPVMPASYCRHAQNPMTLEPELLDVVWAEEGDSATLLYDGEVMAVIPPWATPAFCNVSGYARECSAAGFIGLRPLEEVRDLIDMRVQEALEFWSYWASPRAWQDFLTARLHILEEHFGPHTHYFALDENKFPPRALVVFDYNDAIICVTIGMSIMKQPRVELFVDNPYQFRRFEWGMAFTKEFVETFTLQKIAASIGLMASVPWDRLCWIGSGHTVDCNLFMGDDPNTVFDSVFMIERGLGIPSMSLPDYRGDPVNLLWALPISNLEREYLRQNSSDVLTAKLQESGHSWIYRPRKSSI